MRKIYNIDKPFVDGLNEDILLIAKQSFHTMFFMKQLWYELNKKCDIKSHLLEGMLPDHESCELPIDDKKFKLFPWNFNSFDAVVGDSELNLLSLWLSDGNDIESFYEDQSIINSSKPSFVIDKIQRMTKDFASNLQKIAEENDIPYFSIIELTKLITSGGNLKKIRVYEELPGHPPISDRVHFTGLSKLITRITGDQQYLEEEEIMLSDHFILSKIHLPKGLSEKKQKKLILKLSDHIYNLLIESFWVLLILDWIEYSCLLNFIKKNNPFTNQNNLERIKSYLIDQTPFYFLEERIGKIESEKVLFNEYIATQYYASGKFHSVMETFVKQNMSKTVKRYNFIIEKTSGSKPMGKDIKSFAYVFLCETVKKINTGFLMTYKLNGDPYHLLSYTKSIFYKSALTEINKMQNVYSHSELGISYKTAKQYIKDINQGKIHIGHDIIEKLSVYDLTPDIVQIVSSHNKQNQKHEKTGFISQRDLLSKLQNEVFLAGLRKKGHPLKKYGETTLKKALQKLKQDKKIIYTKEKNAMYYRQTDVPGIVDELTNYFNTKRKK